jgi:endogenous inhibitor of DNA gyrase (YacG/DUF329 family)
MSLLEHLPPVRREPVQAFLDETVGTCPYCGKTVTRSDSRGIDADERIGCFPCVTAVEGACGICTREVSRREKRQQDPRLGLVHRTCLDERDRRR